MANFFSEYKKPAISAVVFFVTLATLSYSYAAFTALTSVVTGQALSKDAWNTMVANLSDLNGRTVPQGAVMAFFWTSCPTNWSPADGTANGVRKTDGSTGTLDLRGEFIRGLDGARWVDSGRTLGSLQNGTEIPMPYGWWWIQIIDDIYNYDGTVNRSSSSIQPTITSWNAATSWPFRTARPRNVALLYCVKN